MDQDDIDWQVALNANLCLAWKCRNKAGKSGYCDKHEVKEEEKRINAYEQFMRDPFYDFQCGG